MAEVGKECFCCRTKSARSVLSSHDTQSSIHDTADSFCAYIGRHSFIVADLESYMMAG